MPNLNAHEKVYFTDPLLARLAHLRAEHLPAPDTSKISEQQIGLALVRHLADGDPGRYADFTSVMYARSATQKEVDFCGRPLGQVAFEGKYVDENLARETQTMRAMFTGGVVATRSKLDDISGARAIPAPFIAYLLTR
jgi:predicted AAA+ superfamily ATPase